MQPCLNNVPVKLRSHVGISPLMSGISKSMTEHEQAIVFRGLSMVELGTLLL